MKKLNNQNIQDLLNEFYMLDDQSKVEFISQLKTNTPNVEGIDEYTNWDGQQSDQKKTKLGSDKEKNSRFSDTGNKQRPEETIPDVRGRQMDDSDELKRDKKRQSHTH